MIRRVLHFLGYWLWLGFTGGAAVLLFVAAPLADFLAQADVSRGNAELALAGLAALWVLFSAGLAFLLERNLTSRWTRGGAHAVGVIACALVFGAFVQAGSGMFRGFRGSSESWGERFTFGPYPQAEDCVRLQHEGYTAIISLMSPLVPFEAVLLQQERDAARATDIELIEAPMLPWVTDNRESLDRLRALAQDGDGRYYVHCYLGRHRAELAKATIMAALGETMTVRAVELPEHFERGTVRRLDNRFILGPLPTEEEWFEFVLRAQVKHVVCLLDETTAAARVAEARTAAQNFAMTFHLRRAGTADEARETAHYIRALDGAVYIHAYTTDAAVDRLAAALAGGNRGGN